MATSFGGFLAAYVAMYWAAAYSYWIVLALAPLAAGFLVRIFIIQHDCGHGSFFRSRRANHVLGTLCGFLTVTPYASWRRQHAGHHGVWNDLDRRQSGADIYSSCLTVAEYRALSPWRRRLYRFTRHPLVANVLLPPLVFIVLYRVPFDTPKRWRRERRGVYATDAVLVAAIIGLGLLLGFGRVAAVQLSVMVPASIIGVWLFSVQHRFEHTHWAPRGEWRFGDAALLGSSYLRLPRILQWFTGNIGFHHIHHLDPRIPNYRLPACHDANPALRTGPSMTLRSALGQWRYALWDEVRERMVSFKAAGGTAPPKIYPDEAFVPRGSAGRIGGPGPKRFTRIPNQAADRDRHAAARANADLAISGQPRDPCARHHAACARLSRGGRDCTADFVAGRVGVTSDRGCGAVGSRRNRRLA